MAHFTKSNGVVVYKWGSKLFEADYAKRERQVAQGPESFRQTATTMSYTLAMDFDLFLKANEIGIKLEITAGMYS